MYAYAWDRTFPAMVAICYGSDSALANFNEEAKLIPSLIEDAKALGRPVIYLMDMHPECPPADSKTRQLIAERSRSYPVPFLYAMVTPKVFFRNIVRLAMHLRPIAGTHANVFSTVGAAAAWIDHLSPASAATLLALHRQATAKIGAMPVRQGSSANA